MELSGKEPEREIGELMIKEFVDMSFSTLRLVRGRCAAAFLALAPSSLLPASPLGRSPRKSRE